MNITRKFREYKATAYKVVTKDGKAELEPDFTCDYLAVTADERTARRELKNAGYPVTRSTVVTIEPGAIHRYTATIEAFLSIATDTIVSE